MYALKSKRRKGGREAEGGGLLVQSGNCTLVVADGVHPQEQAVPTPQLQAWRF